MTYLKFRDRFAEAMDPDFHRIEELDAKVADGSALLWSTDNSAIAAELQHYPNALVLHCLCATGELSEIVGELADRAERWAKQAGCTHTIVESRAGWAKALRKRGYEVHQIKLGKVL